MDRKNSPSARPPAPAAARTPGAVPDPTLDRLTRLAAQCFGVPLATLTLAAPGASSVISSWGFDLSRPAHDPVAAVFPGPDLLLIPDTAADPRFSSAPHIRFYAAIPLAGPDGRTAVLAIMDTAPRDLLPDSLAPLRDLAALVEREFHSAPSAAHSVQELADSLPAIMWLAGPSGEGLFVNNSWREFTGLSFDDGLGLNWLNVVHPDDRAHTLASIRHAVENKVETAFECRIRRADGEYRWILDTARPRFHSDGSFAGLAGLCVDLTPLKQAEAARHRIEERLRLAQESIAVGLWEWDIGTNLITCSEQYLALYGLGSRDPRFSYAEWLAWVHPDDRARLLHNQQNLAGLDHYESEFRVVWPDGSIHWIFNKSRVFHDPAGNPVRAAGVNVDTTRLREAEASLRASENRFRLLIEHSSELIGIVDSTAVMRYLSPSSRRLLGYDPAAVTGRPLADFAHPDDLPGLLRDIGALSLSPGSTVTSEYRIRHADGSWRLLEGAATSLLHVPGMQGIVFNCHDITERKRVESELRDSRDQLRRLAAHVESIRESERIHIAREIHDELGQLLSALRLELDGIAARPPAPATLSRKLRTLVRRIDSIVDAVRRISAELRPGVLDHLGIAAALDWQIQRFRASSNIRCRATGIAGTLALSPEHSTAVFRIFQEVLTNVARHAGATSIRVQTAVDSGSFTLTVADNGCGFDPARLSDLHSLGILGMRERASLLGGAVDFSPREGGGTVVTLRLPAGPPPAAPPVPDPAAAIVAVPSACPRILLADDHAVFRTGLKAVLARFWPGAFFGEAADGALALDAVRAAPWDILVLDLHMPGLSGVDVLAALASVSTRPPVLVLSMESEAAWLRRARQAGASGYLSKKHAGSRIVDAVTAILGGGQWF